MPFQFSLSTLLFFFYFLASEPFDFLFHLFLANGFLQMSDDVAYLLIRLCLQEGNGKAVEPYLFFSSVYLCRRSVSKWACLTYFNIKLVLMACSSPCIHFCGRAQPYCIIIIICLPHNCRFSEQMLYLIPFCISNFSCIVLHKS